MAETDFPLVEQIENAPSKRAMAQSLLRVPDAIVLSHGNALMAACRRARFNEGAQYLTMRQLALDAVRDRSGRLPDAVALPLENWRVSFAAFAQTSPR